MSLEISIYDIKRKCFHTIKPDNIDYVVHVTSVNIIKIHMKDSDTVINVEYDEKTFQQLLYLSGKSYTEEKTVSTMIVPMISDFKVNQYGNLTIECGKNQFLTIAEAEADVLIEVLKVGRDALRLKRKMRK